MSKDIEKYANWRAITESDYVTMFIKTWFAFIATLRELYPDIDVFDENGKPRGDRPFTNKYKEDAMLDASKSINIKEFVDILLKIYKPSRLKISEIFPQYFFTTFYRINEHFNYSDENIEYDEETKKIKDRVYVALKNEDRWILCVNFQVNGKYKKSNYNECLKVRINIKEVIESIDLSNRLIVSEDNFLQSFYKRLYDKIELKVNEWVVRRDLNTKYNGEIKTLIESKFNYILNKILSVFNYYKNTVFENNKSGPDDYFMVIKQRPLSNFTKEFTKNVSDEEGDFLYKKVKEDVFSWFLDFIVGLRNALFHEIINPLDVEWQLIFKNAYLALKMLLDTTIDFSIKKKLSMCLDEILLQEENNKFEEKTMDMLLTQPFVLKDNELIDDIEIDNICIHCFDRLDLSSLIVDGKQAKFRCKVQVLVDGRATIFDEKASVWDREDESYVYVVHSNIRFAKGEASLEIEFTIEVDYNDIESSIMILDVRKISFGDIKIDLRNAQVEAELIYPQEDYYED